MRNLVLCDIGDGQDILDNLSTFSAHITNVLEILKRATGESLVILDELGSARIRLREWGLPLPYWSS